MSQVMTGVPVDAVVAGMRKQLAANGLDASTIHLVQGPLYHAAPLGMANFTLIVGGVCHVMPSFEPEEALRLIERHAITSSIMVPTMFVRLLRLPDEVKGRYDLSSLKLVIHTGAIMPTDVKRKMIDWWGPVLVDGYGASELGVVCQIGSEEWLRKPGSVGRPLPTFTVEIIGEDGEELPAGEVGQVYLTSLTDVDISYIGEPEKTASVHRAAKQFTLGDMGWLDDDGYLFLADRRNDMIVSGGVNIYPAETEAAMLAHPAVEDVGVFGVPDPEWGQQVKAAVQLRAGHTASDELEAELIAWLRERIAHYKVPRSIDFHEALPRFTNGKLHRRVLREPYWEDGGGGDRLPGERPGAGRDLAVP
jgi:long-chain acyl-CoA synthetase